MRPSSTTKEPKMFWRKKKKTDEELRQEEGNAALVRDLSNMYLEGRIPYVIPLMVSIASKLGTLSVHTIHGVLDTNRKPYMHRISLFKRTKFELRIHWIQSKDWGTHTHDHPFDFYRLILSGGYVERVLPEEGDEDAIEHVLNSAGYLSFVKAETQHIIESVLPDTFTLVLTGPRRRDWGFIVNDRWIYWEEYIDLVQAGLIVIA